jgi:hypothetical protein
VRFGHQSINEQAWAGLVLHGLLALARGLLRGDNGLQRLAQALPVAPGTLDLSLSLGRRGIGGLASSHPSCARQLKGNVLHPPTPSDQHPLPRAAGSRAPASQLWPASLSRVMSSSRRYWLPLLAH